MFSHVFEPKKLNQLSFSGASDFVCTLSWTFKHHEYIYNILPVTDFQYTIFQAVSQTAQWGLVALSHYGHLL